MKSVIKTISRSSTGKAKARKVNKMLLHGAFVFARGVKMFLTQMAVHVALNTREKENEIKGCRRRIRTTLIHTTYKSA